MKKLEDLSLEEFESLKQSGILWEFFPESPENWNEIEKVHLPEPNRINIRPTNIHNTPNIEYKFCTYERYIEIHQRQYNLANTLIMNIRRK